MSGGSACPYCGNPLALGAVACFRCGRLLAEEPDAHSVAEPTAIGTAARGQLIDGRYRLLEALGQGSVGVVWKARDTQLDRDVALKLLHSHLAEQPEAIAAFEHAGAAAAQHEHPGLLPLLAIGTAGQQPFLVFKLLTGPSLPELLHQQGGTLGSGAVVTVLRSVLEALGCLHGLGQAHRDLKPSNVRFDAEGRPVLLDAGLARNLGEPRTRSGQFEAMAPYLAPEELTSTAGPAADLYSLGCVAYELLTGHPPFSGTPAEVLSAHRMRPAPALEGVEPALAAAIGRALEKNPASRFANAGAFALALPRIDAAVPLAVAQPVGPAPVPPAREEPTREEPTREEPTRPMRAEPRERDTDPIEPAPHVYRSVPLSVLAQGERPSPAEPEPVAAPKPSVGSARERSTRAVSAAEKEQILQARFDRRQWPGWLKGVLVAALAAALSPIAWRELKTVPPPPPAIQPMVQTAPIAPPPSAFETTPTLDPETLQERIARATGGPVVEEPAKPEQTADGRRQGRARYVPGLPNPPAGVLEVTTTYRGFEVPSLLFLDGRRVGLTPQVLPTTKARTLHFTLVHQQLPPMELDYPVHAGSKKGVRLTVELSSDAPPAASGERTSGPGKRRGG